MYKRIIGIYKITSPTNRIYIGQSININKRFYAYKRLECKGQYKLYKSLIKYGADKHKFEILETCLEDELNIKERFYQELYETVTYGLNCGFVDSNAKRQVMTEEVRARRRESKLGIRNPMFGVKGKDNPLFGKKLPENWRNSLSEASANKKLTLCLNTGIFYDSLIQACEAYTLNYGSTMNKMQGHRKNNTALIYV